jgi:hypothetical protein
VRSCISAMPSPAATKACAACRSSVWNATRAMSRRRPGQRHGGPDVDRFEQDWTDGEARMVLTLDGGADDGRPGEADDVRGVEELKSFQPGRYVGTGGADRIELVQIEGPSSLDGAGGDDFLKVSDGSDTLDGGVGADTVRADAVDTAAPDCETVERGAAEVDVNTP